MRKKIPIIYKDKDILVCEKPIGMSIQSDKSNNLDVISQLKKDLYLEENLSEEPYLAAVHRLDRPVGGLTVLARNQEAAANLSRQIQEHEFEKDYQAVICGELPEEVGTFEDYLLHDTRTNQTRVVPEGTKGAKYARLDYELIDEIESKQGLLAWVLIHLETGRHHQIRVQFASRHLPLYGDAKYNKAFQKQKKYTQLALYSTRIAFDHPKTKEHLVYKTDPQGDGFDAMDVEAY
ncbi:MAG: RNA pseudouridine synthase [Lachnospiraceae bacterium]|nr:RNA pseudouridine synthase [Lachnospiraceae bacterium]